MKKISVAFHVSFGVASPRQKYLPALNKLKNNLCNYYGYGFPRNFEFTDEPIKSMRLTKIPTRINAFIVTPLSKIFHYPKYYGYLSSVKILDLLIANKVANDSSEIVYTSPLLVRTVEKAKKKGKVVVLEAGNSEPEREYQRIHQEYELYGIKNQYIYGNQIFKNTCLKSFALADYVVTISNVSANTYKNAGYDMDKFKVISLAGTDLPIQPYELAIGKKKAFISTAFHSFIKGTHRLLDAWRKANIQNVPLIIVGRLCEDMEEYISKNGPFENIEFIGHRSDLKEWYKQYDAVGVLMSLSEGAVRVTPEMMSFGFPMLVSEDATCDLVQNGYNGYIVDCFDEDALAERLSWFAEDWTRVHEMRNNVLQSVINRSVQDFSNEVGDYLLSLLEK